MNLLTNNRHKGFREAILDGNVDKARKLLSVQYGKPDINYTLKGGFTLLHCAALTGNPTMTLFLLRAGAQLLALTHDGFTALDIAIWRRHLEVIDVLRHAGCIAPMKEPVSLNGYWIMYHEKYCVQVIEYIPGNPSTRAILMPNGDIQKVALWAGSDYSIIGEQRGEEHVNNDVNKTTTLENNQNDIVSHEENEEEEANEDNEEGDDEDLEELMIVHEIIVPPGPLGVLLNSSIHDHAVVQGFQKLPDGSCGAIEASNVVEVGMAIVGINDENTGHCTLQETVYCLGTKSLEQKRIRFGKARSVFNLKETTTSRNNSIDNNDTLPVEKEEVPLVPQLPCSHCGMSLHLSQACPYS